MKLHIESVETADELRALGPDWRSLFDCCGVDLPFYTFEWAECWWKHMRQDCRSVRDTLSFRVIRDENERLVSIAPLICTERPSVGPFRMRYLQFLGADPNMTEVRGMLTLPGLEAEAYRTLTSDLERSSWDWIRWSGFRTEQGQEADSSSWSFELDAVRDQILTLSHSWDEYKAGLPRNIRESLRKCYNSLKRDNHVAELRVCRGRADIGTALDRFLVLHRARAEAEAAIPHANVFETEAAQRFLRDVCGHLADSGICRVFELLVNGETVASRIGFQFKDSLYLYYSGYRPEWARYSVMTTTLAETIKYAIGQGLTTIDLSPGIDVGKTRWRPGEVIYRQGIQIASSPRSRLAYKAYENAFHLRENKMLRSLTRHSGLKSDQMSARASTERPSIS